MENLLAYETIIFTQRQNGDLLTFYYTLYMPLNWYWAFTYKAHVNYKLSINSTDFNNFQRKTKYDFRQNGGQK